MLDTNLKHVDSEEYFNALINDNDNVMICCGRMGPMCLPVYSAMEQIKDDYPKVEFRDMDFDSIHAHVIKKLPECSKFRGLPFTVYYKNGKVVAATTSVQTEEQIRAILNR
ncbi:hypothetical protein [Clostridium sp.]|uniref:hypothetical protein n=1 Tax=Clostridium sp. TaxID=1506 RepID=UPI003D6D5CD9